MQALLMGKAAGGRLAIPNWKIYNDHVGRAQRLVGAQIQ